MKTTTRISVDKVTLSKKSRIVKLLYLLTYTLRNKNAKLTYLGVD